MAEKIGDAILEIRTDTKKLVKGMSAAKQKADKSMQQMQSRADKFAKFMKGAMGIGGVVLVYNKLKRVVGDLVTTYGVQETAEAKLKSAIRATGKEASISADTLFQYASELQGVTTYGDEATISAMAMLQQLGDLNEEGLKQTIPLVQDFAAAMGVDLETAASLVGKTLGSSTNALSRYGLEVDMTGTKQEKLTSLSDAMEKQFGGMAQQLAITSTEAITQYNNALGDLKEVYGETISKGMEPFVRGLTTIIIDMARAKREAIDTKEAYQALRELGEGEALAADQTLLILQDQVDLLGRVSASYEHMDDAAVAAWEAAKQKLADYNRALANHAYYQALDLKILNEREKVDAKNKATAAKRLVDEIAFIAKIKDKWAETDEGRAAALETEIKMFETIMTQADKTIPLFEDVLNYLYAQRDVQEEQNIALEEHISATEALSIAAAEAYLIEKNAIDAANKATQDKLESMQDMAVYLSGPFREAYGEAFETLGQVMIEGGNALEVFREAFKKTIADMLTMLGKYLAIEVFRQAVARNFAGAALAAVGSAAAFTASGAVMALATGGDFETRGPQMIMVGDNPGGRERVSVTPVSSPNVNGPGQMIHVTFILGSRVLYDDISRATENGELMINPRSIKR